MESARPATEDDLEVIDAIALRRRDEIVDERGGVLYLAREAGPLPPGDRVKTALAEPDDNIVVVGTYDDVVFGFGWARIESLNDGSRLARLEGFVVDADIRGSGIGEAMMNLVVAEARSRRCRAVDAYALPGDRSTKNFFESFGLKARLLTVTRALDDSP